MHSLLKIIELHGDKKSRLIIALKALQPGVFVTNTHINNWLYRDKKVPSDWVLVLSESVDWQVTPHQLRPDIYPHPEDGLPEGMRCQCDEKAA